MPSDATNSPWVHPSPLQRAATTRWLALLTLSALSGLLLFVSDYPVHAWPLQLVALVPVLWALRRAAGSMRAAAVAGAVVGAVYTGPLIVALEFPLLLGGGLALYISVLWVLLVAGAYRTLRWSSPWGALATGALAAVVEWADCALLPIWGTAQAFVRVWSAAPWAVQFSSLVGVTGIVFVVVSLQALAVSAAHQRVGRAANGAALVGLLIVLIAANAYRWSAPPVGQLRVAAMGWTNKDLPWGKRSVYGVLDKLYKPLFEMAAEQGARLIVSPETGFWASANERDELLRELGALARQHGVWLAAGYFDAARNDNRIAFIDPTGTLRAEYAKTHLISGIENYRAGSGRLVVLPLDQVLLGGMICQDDNFTDLARGLGRRGVGLVVVPTNDWLQVKDHHLENTLFRPIENGYAIVRAATNGISVIASPRGEVLAAVDHFGAGPSVIVADVPIGTGNTFYSRHGEWWSLCCAFGLFVGSLLEQRRRRARRDTRRAA